MADRIPIKGIFNGSGDPTGLAEFTVSDSIGYADGGTGLTTLGTAYQVLQVNSGATALEYTTISNQNLTNSTISIAADSGSTDPISLGETLTISGDTGITTTVGANSLSIDLDDTAVTPGSYGSATAIPTFTVDQQGRLTAASTINVATTLNISDDSSTITGISLLNDTLNFKGDTGITTTISGDSINIDLDDTAVTPGTYGSTTAIPTFTVDQQGRITNVSTNTVSTTLSISDDSSTTASINLLNDTLNISGTTNEIETSITGDTIQIGLPDDVTIGNNLSVGNNLTITGNLTVNGTTTTVNSTEVNVQNAFVFEGTTADEYETTLTVTDPTADRTITLPNATGQVVLRDTTDTLTNKIISGASNTLSNIGNGSLTNSTTTFTGDSGTTAIALGGTLNVIGDTGITVSATTGQLSVDLDDTAVTPGSYGSSTAVPVITIDQQGRITSASTSSISTDLTIRDSSSTTDTVTLGTDTLSFLGTDNEITATVSNNAVTLALPYAVSIETDTGLIQRDVNFYSRADGLSTANSTLTFSAGGDTNVFTAFTYADGTTGTGSVLFHF